MEDCKETVVGLYIASEIHRYCHQGYKLPKLNKAPNSVAEIDNNIFFNLF
jgi:hypothetical protein